MNKKLAIILPISIICIVAGIWCVLNLFMTEVPNTETEDWEGIYRCTVFKSEDEREIIGVIINEDDARSVELTVTLGYSGHSCVVIDNTKELELEKTDKITFSMKAMEPMEGAEISPDDISDVYVELKYVDEDTICIRYGYTEEEMKNNEFIELERTVV